MSKLIIINPIPYAVKDICEEVIDKGMNARLSMKCIGQGSHSTVYQFPGGDLVIKIFNLKAIRGNYLDYKYLLKLQDIDCVPKIYAYAENKFVVMEMAKGLSLSEYYKKYKKLPDNFLEVMSIAVYEIAERKCIHPDLKIGEHVFWDDSTQTVKIIDYGVFDDYNHMPDDFVKGFADDIINGVKEYIEKFKH